CVAAPRSRRAFPPRRSSDLVLVEEVDRRHDHARGAVAALESVLLPEPLLHRVELTVAPDPLHGGHLAPARLYGEDGARLGALAKIGRAHVSTPVTWKSRMPS